MKFIRVILLLSALGLPAFAQQVNVTANKIKVETPSGACSAGSVRVTTAGALWTCVSGTWTAAGGGGLTVGTTTITGGTTTKVLYDNAGVVGEYTITGTGNVVMSAGPTLTGRISAADGLYATTVTTGTGATAGLQVTANSLTTGNGLEISSSSVTTGNIVKITGTSTAAASNTLTGLNIALSGANASTAQTVTGQTISVTNTNATSGTNVALTLTASGATTANTALNVTAGQVSLPNGTAALPSLVFAASTATGFRSNSTSYISLAAGGANTVALGVGGVQLQSTGGMTWGSTSDAYGSSEDVGFVRLATKVLRLASGASNAGAGSLVLGTSTVGSIGTSGVGVLAIANGTAPTSYPADEFQLYSADSAAGDANAFIGNEAGEVNRLSGLTARNSAQFDKTSSTTLSNITGLTRNVEAGRTYAFTVVLQTTAAATGGLKAAISGTATATAISYEGILAGGAALIAQTRSTALDGVVCASTTTTAGTCTIRGVIQVNAAGTLTVQFAQNNSDGTASSVLANQYLQLIPIS